MAACGSLRPLFEKPMPENPTLIESLSWNQIKVMHHPMEQPPSFTEIFGELHFKEKPNPSPPPVAPSPCPPPPPSSSITTTDVLPALDKKKPSLDVERTTSIDSLLGKPQNPIFSEPSNNGGGFPSLLGSSPGEQNKAASFSNPCFLPPASPESLHLCTEGLGSESSDDVEMDGDREETGGDRGGRSGWNSMRCWSEERWRRGRGVAFPPPISCIGSSGKPSICFKSYKGDGRFVLREVRIPSQEFLHASREDGRLKLHLMQTEEAIDEDREEEEEEIQDEDEDEDEDEEEEEEEEKKQSTENDGNCEDNRT